ncbi:MULTISPECIES: acetolactate synthase small subunit [Sporomusa]|jgi:acetolactate synthase-1/3 small subunit|uniref:Acetolactate synthase small subunit n=1 Tax=Sporomusa sphaeroides DSM 2875 TaxID=1337886 RepID=A0ABM9W6T8_9FIRM|nr:MULTISPECIES: acetolactate synthase small subunit [Sporomusa]MCM0758816.1 acetolactate synthase small subunit [Sporomusa sphaeroides DSM 2875]OLS54593.1 putative acetolactate synthase small subunit [Sporomusa sphaeroides DSM 2875]CVK20876.1 Putative acetolactate synthase small subunit [Sporomusa sphaeroides DSM 2875]HML35695.1 acetolactate synthase small subunit [Sporomusa sphaeroides]
MKYTLAVLVENRPGVLTHIAGLISRRAFNIESIAAGYTEEPDTTRITISVEAENEVELEQVVNQLSKLVDVIKIVNLTYVESIERELALIKVKASKTNRSDLVNVVEIFRAKIIDINRETMAIELTGEESKIDAFCEVLLDFGIIEIVRTGKIALSRGPVPAKEM